MQVWHYVLSRAPFQDLKSGLVITGPWSPAIRGLTSSRAYWDVSALLLPELRVPEMP